MGTWGVGIFQHDLAQDVREFYRDGQLAPSGVFGGLGRLDRCRSSERAHHHGCAPEVMQLTALRAVNCTAAEKSACRGELTAQPEHRGNAAGHTPLHGGIPDSSVAGAGVPAAVVLVRQGTS